MAVTAHFNAILPFVGGFTLAGYRQDNGSVKSTGLVGNTEIITYADWPQEVVLNGITYTLEEVTRGGYIPGKGQFENAEYV